MVMVSSFTLKYNRETGFYEVISSEPHQCPYCGGWLFYRSRVKRGSRNKAGDGRRYLLRRLECELCGASHREMPDIIQPYKHYDSEAIQFVLDSPGKALECLADESTKRRWKRGFSAAEPDIAQRLVSVYAQMTDGTAPIVSATEDLSAIRANAPRWLAHVTGLLINNGHKLCTRFAFCPGRHCGKVTPTIKKEAKGGGESDKTINDSS